MGDVGALRHHGGNATVAELTVYHKLMTCESRDEEWCIKVKAYQGQVGQRISRSKYIKVEIKVKRSIV